MIPTLTELAARLDRLVHRNALRKARERDVRRRLAELERDLDRALAARAAVRRADSEWRSDAARRGWRTREGQA